MGYAFRITYSLPVIADTAVDLFDAQFKLLFGGFWVIRLPLGQASELLYVDFAVLVALLGIVLI